MDKLYYERLIKSLTQEVERETITFEANVVGTPFLLPKNTDSPRMLQRHCAALDGLLAEYLDYQHTGWMAKTDTKGVAFQIFEYSQSVGPKLDSFPNPRSGVDSARVLLKSALVKGLRPASKLLGTTPRMMPRMPGVLIAYIVFMDNTIIQMINDGVGALDLFDTMEAIRSLSDA